VNPGGEARAFRRGVRIAAGFAALLVVVVVIFVVRRDHPLEVDTHLNPPAADRAAVQASDNGALPRTGDAPTGTAGVVGHPGPDGSDLSPHK
jgi:hypothetical protein